MPRLVRSGLVLLTVLTAATTVSAAPIIAPTAGVINEGTPGFGALEDTFNQAGLLFGYTAGVTDFDGYLASNPLHSIAFEHSEWFSNAGRTAATVTYDFGVVAIIDRLALWNEESSGISRLHLSYSLDNIVFVALLSALQPVDRPVANYGAEVFAFDPVNARYVRFEMSGCPQAVPGNFPACAVGEVAFRGQLVQQVVDVPEPSSLLLFGTALLIVAAIAKRRSSKAK